MLARLQGKLLYKAIMGVNETSMDIAPRFARLHPQVRSALGFAEEHPPAWLCMRTVLAQARLCRENHAGAAPAAMLGHAGCAAATLMHTTPVLAWPPQLRMA